MTLDHPDRARAFAALHVPGAPLVLFNVWDPGSARAVEASGAAAIATGSWSVAAANGFGDGEQVPRDLALANLSRITAAVDLPVTIDLERGYADDAAGVGRTVSAAIAAGAVGCNLEDGDATGGLRPVDDQVERVTQARQATGAEAPFFINARTDVFLLTPRNEHDDALLGEALTRARAYADAGADGIFLPGLVDADLIGEAVRALDRPVNVMVSDGLPSAAELTELGVARISHGPGPYVAAMNALREAARAAIS